MKKHNWYVFILCSERKDALDGAQDDEAFDVAVEDAISDRPSKRSKGPGDKQLPRHVRDKRFGFGGAGRRSKQNTKESTDDFEQRRGGGKPGRGGKAKGRGGAQRPGKSRRMAARGRR